MTERGLPLPWVPEGILGVLTFDHVKGGHRESRLFLGPVGWDRPASPAAG
jgi:hypothetical protein